MLIFEFGKKMCEGLKRYPFVLVTERSRREKNKRYSKKPDLVFIERSGNINKVTPK